jgi:hypothetical protein
MMQTEKTMQRLGWFMGRHDLNPNSIFGFFVVYRYEHRCTISLSNLKSDTTEEEEDLPLSILLLL